MLALHEQGRAGLLYARTHGIFAALGVLFLVVVISERIVPPSSGMDGILRVAGLVIWGAFFAEFFVRLFLSADKRIFLRKNWWHAILLAIPFLNIARAAAAIRITRLGRVVSASLRGTRSARSRLTGRVGWVLTVTVVVILLSADLLYEVGNVTPYAKALHDAGLATITGEPTGLANGFVQGLEFLLALYSVVFFAALAGTLGAYFLARDRERDDVES